jgi:hypothetical protein
MSSAIGRAALVLTVNQQGLRSGLAQSSTEVNRWADNVGRGMTARMGNAGRSAGSGMMGGIAAAAARVPGPIMAAAAGFVGLNQAMETLHETARTGAAANAFGIGVESFSGMQGVAASVGEGQREFIESLVTLGKVSAEGAAGKGEVATEWFKKLGVNAAEFNALPIDEKFFKVWEALKNIENPAERVRALMVAFGEDGGKYLLPLLAKAPAEIRAMADGFKINADQVAAATAANTAMTRAQNTLSRAWRGAVVAVAPLFEKLAGGVERMQPLFDWMGRAFSTVGTIGGAVLTEVGNLIGWVVDQVGGWAKELGLFAGGVPTIEQVITNHFRVMGTAAALVWDTLRSGAGIAAIAFGAVIEHGGSVMTMFRNIVDLGEHLPDALKPEGFDRFAGAVRAADDKVRGYGRGIREWGQGAVSSWGQSAGQFNAWLDRVTAKQAEATGRNAAAAAGSANQVAAAVTKLDNAALLKGSAAEVSVRMKHEFGGKSAEERTADAVKTGNGILAGIKSGIETVADRIGSGGLLPF